MTQTKFKKFKNLFFTILFALFSLLNNALYSTPPSYDTNKVWKITFDNPSTEFYFDASSFFDEVNWSSASAYTQKGQPLNDLYVDTNLKRIAYFGSNPIDEFYIIEDGLNNIKEADLSSSHVLVIKISNPNSYDLTDFQVRANLSGYNYSNFELIDSSGNVIPYCYEQQNGECNTSPANIIWIKVPHIPANGEITLNLVRGIDGSVNGDQVFDFYDDFNGNSLDTNKWQCGNDYYGCINYALENGLLKTWSTNGWKTIETKNDFIKPEDKIIVEVRLKSNSADKWHMFYLTDKTNNGTYLRFGIIDGPYSGNDIGIQLFQKGSSSYPKNLGTMNNNVWYRIRIIKKSQTHFRGEFLDDNGNLIGYYENSNLDYDDRNWVIRQWKYYNTYDYWDWVRVRKYANKEPTVTFISYELTELTPDVKKYSVDLTSYSTEITEGATYGLKTVKKTTINSAYEGFSNVAYTIYFDSGSKKDSEVSSLTSYTFSKTFEDYGLSEGNHTLSYLSVENEIGGFKIGDYVTLGTNFELVSSYASINYPNDLNFNSVSYADIVFSQTALDSVILDGVNIIGNCSLLNSDTYRCPFPSEITKEQHTLKVNYHDISEPTLTGTDTLDFYVTAPDYGNFGYWVDVLNITNYQISDKNLLIRYEFEQNNTFPYTLKIDWGDGIIQTIEQDTNRGCNGYITHTYNDYGIYVVKLFVVLGDENNNMVVEGEEIPITLSEGGTTTTTTNGTTTGNTSVSVTVESPYNDTWKDQMNKWRDFLFIILALIFFYVGYKHKIVFKD